ncbi:MAG: HNH endonuclease [Chloroflexi bacterium]|nr:HNH endonuclease [Chloroflexota bacterium]
MNSVLVLNATYEPLNVVSVQRAIVLLLKDKAELVEAAESRLHSINTSIPVPLVIRLVYYVRVPHKLNVPLTRRTVMLRDNYSCQYCGAQLAKSDLTIDHVVPRVRGGETTWENVVCACKQCNLRKGSKTPEQAGMRLRSTPGRPKYLALVWLSNVHAHEVWHKYLPDLDISEQSLS